jgi:uncharacterized protein YecE (DUF72 family)
MKPAENVEVLAPDFPEEWLRLGRALPSNVYLGTSSWYFPGWQGIVYGGAYSERKVAREGLAAYARHPLLRTVGIDRTFYRPLAAEDFARYASQVPPHFRFLVKAPASIADAVTRGDAGAPAGENPTFLDAATAIEQLVQPALEGLGERAGPLLFQLSPMPSSLVRGPGARTTIERVGAFLAALPRAVGGHEPRYAVELRDAPLLTPRFVRALRVHGARLCIGIHPRMPDAARQAAALRAMDALPEEGEDWRMKGPLVVRWNLRAGLGYEQARTRYKPFDRLVDPDPATRVVLAHLVRIALRSGQPSFIIVNNKAEGSAPLGCVELAKAIVDRSAAPASEAAR